MKEIDRREWWLAALFVSAGAMMLAACAGAGGPVKRDSSHRQLAPIATPEDITLQPLGKAQGYDLGKETASILIRDRIAFADTRGMTLYTYDKDPPNASVCVAQCTEEWRPLIAPARAQVYGDWSTIRRPDEQRQWAYKGKPLYTYFKDLDPGSVGGDDPARLGSRRKNSTGQYVGGGVRGSLEEEGQRNKGMPSAWKPALAYPLTDIALPAGITVREVPDAEALVLVDYRSRTLYAFDGDAAKDGNACSQTACLWQPAAAPEASGPVGDFAFLVREDGVKQWTYKGQGLYTYSGDLTVGDAYGVGVDPRWHVAAVLRYYMPADVMLVNTPGQGKVLATAEGKTLYRRDGYIFQSGGGHSLRRGNTQRPAVGRDLGANARCRSECDKWHPFLAPADAQPRGFWSVYTRSDGSKQWAYQGFALWTYDGDKRAGDMNGNDNLEYAFDDEASTPKARPLQVIDDGTPQDGTPALYWAITVP